VKEQYGDFQLEIYLNGTKGVLPRYPVDAASLERQASTALPPWIPAKKGKDNWQTTAWAQSAGHLKKEVATVVADDHF